MALRKKENQITSGNSPHNSRVSRLLRVMINFMHMAMPKLPMAARQNAVLLARAASPSSEIANRAKRDSMESVEISVMNTQRASRGRSTLMMKRMKLISLTARRAMPSQSKVIRRGLSMDGQVRATMSKLLASNR